MMTGKSKRLEMKRIRNNGKAERTSYKYIYTEVSKESIGCTPI